MHQTFGAFLVNGLSAVCHIVKEGQQVSHQIHQEHLFSLWFEPPIAPQRQHSIIGLSLSLSLFIHEHVDYTHSNGLGYHVEVP